MRLPALDIAARNAGVHDLADGAGLPLYIGEWIKTDGKTINVRYQLGGSLDNIRTSFFKLLNGMCDTKGGSVQIGRAHV